MAESIATDICVIGGGSAGLSVAAGASQMGAKTVLIECAKMGGDCLNYGCVPSKSLLAASKAAQGHKLAARMGVTFEKPGIDFAQVQSHVQGVVDSIAPMDSVERFEGLGVTVLQAAARFTGPQRVQAGSAQVTARRFVVATGSSALIPPIEGLDQVPYLTNESVFELTERPRRLIVIGGGAIGCELGQAFRRLGSEVVIVEMADIMPRDDPELVALLRTHLRRDGIELHERSRAVAAMATASGIRLRIQRDGQEQDVDGSALLVAAGRRPSIDGLDLAAANIEFDRNGIKVDERLRTTNRKVFAAGDVAGGYQFTHVAGYHAGIVIRNALFRLPAKASTTAIPWVTYTEPELAHVGMTEAEAGESRQDLRILRWGLAENDRARAERKIDGLIKVITTRKGQILGASIIGPQAGEVIQPWILAISSGLKIGAMAQMIAPYPTLGEVNKRVAGSFYTEKLFSERTKSIVRFLARFG